MDNRPLELVTFILKKKNEATAGNQSDHRSTSLGELEEIEQRCDRLYASGLKLRKRISADDMERCRKLCEYRLKVQYGFDGLCEVKIYGKRVLVPRYISYIEELRDLQRILA